MSQFITVIISAVCISEPSSQHSGLKYLIVRCLCIDVSG